MSKHALKKFTIEVKGSFRSAVQYKFAFETLEAVVKGWNKYFSNSHKENTITIRIDEQ